MGLESIDPENLKSVQKGFNKPQEYKAILERLERYGLYAITSFIFGMDSDSPGVAQRTLDVVRTWPPGLPVFGLLTPYPSTPLYDKLMAAGRLSRPKHWLEFKPFTMDFTPLGITEEQAELEIRQAWGASYEPATNAAAIRRLAPDSLADRIIHLIGRLAFRGIYFPQMTRKEWARVLFQNRRPILQVVFEALRYRYNPPSREPFAIEVPEAAEPSA
jgi:radical SAM superfamily enzyme YgiQ (UPF0313 family)